jgi:integrase
MIAMVVTDCDSTNGVLSVTKSRVGGVDRDRTKIAEDRRVVLCERARSVLERQLRLRERLQRTGCIQHDSLFFDANGAPINRLQQVYGHWRQTLQRLAIRYRKPYAARHSSVSWDLMLGRNPLFVAKQHGHSLLTMLSVYAAWTDGSLEADVAAIRRAMRAPAYAVRDGAVCRVVHDNDSVSPQRRRPGRSIASRSRGSIAASGPVNSMPLPG